MTKTRITAIRHTLLPIQGRVVIQLMPLVKEGMTEAECEALREKLAELYADLGSITDELEALAEEGDDDFEIEMPEGADFIGVEITTEAGHSGVIHVAPDIDPKTVEALKYMIDAAHQMIERGEVPGQENGVDEQHALDYADILAIIEGGGCYIEVNDIGDEEQEAEIHYNRNGTNFANPIPLGWVEKLLKQGRIRLHRNSTGKRQQYESVSGIS